MKVGFMAHKYSGCEWYRTRHPMEALNRSGTDTRVIYLNRDFDDDLTAFQFYGAYPFNPSNALEYMKREGKRIVYDADDALDLIEPTNPFHHAVMRDTPSVSQILRYADHITVSTPQMERYVRQKTDKPITVLPNCYDHREWKFPRPRREGIRVGFAGSSTHVGDLIQILPAIKELQDKYDIRFLLMGFSDKAYGEWYSDYRYGSSPQGLAELEEFDRLLSGITFEFVPFVDYENYPSTLTNMSLDIGLCPLNDTPFNRHRSACKAMEYTLSGALAMASDLEPYRNDLNSVLVKDQAWYEAIDKYITDPSLLETARESHLEWTRNNRDIDGKIELIKSAYGQY